VRGCSTVKPVISNSTLAGMSAGRALTRTMSIA
jgi:hypothetical protein